MNSSENSFRVLLDVTELNQLNLKFVWINILHSDIKTVHDFKCFVIKKLNIKDSQFSLYLKSGLLLEDEKISILRENDTVKIYPVKSCKVPLDKDSQVQSTSTQIYAQSNEKYLMLDRPISPSRKHKRKRKSLENRYKEDNYIFEQDDLPEKSENTFSKKKLKKSGTKSFADQNVLLISDIPKVNNSAKKYSSPEDYDRKAKSIKKPKNSKTDFVYNNKNEFFNESLVKTNKNNVQPNFELINHKNKANIIELCKNQILENDVSKPATSMQSVILKTQVDEKNINELDNSRNDPNKPASPCKKRKRKRHRKKKAVASVDQSVSNDLVVDLKNEKISNISDSYSHVRKHIRYDSPSISVINTEELEDSKISNVKTIGSLTIEEKIQKPNLLQKPFDPEITEIPSNEKKNPQVISLHMFPNKKETETFAQTAYFHHDSSCEMQGSEMVTTRNYEKYDKLYVLPNVGTHLAYKVLELNENYSPEISKYKEGKVTKIDPETDDIVIELVNEEIQAGRTGKFEILEEDEIPPSTIIKTVALSWSSLIDPRLIK